MYIFMNSVVETIKTFCMSILCSTLFSFMIYRDTVLFQNTACFILNLTAFLLFLVLYHKNWMDFYSHTYTAAEYIIPAASSFFIYAGLSTCLYIMRASMIYRWMFQHTRFLEPILNNNYAYLSFILSQLVTLIVLVIAPRSCVQKR